MAWNVIESRILYGTEWGGEGACGVWVKQNRWKAVDSNEAVLPERSQAASPLIGQHKQTAWKPTKVGERMAMVVGNIPVHWSHPDSRRLWLINCSLGWLRLEAEHEVMLQLGWDTNNDCTFRDYSSEN
jgi:hypothetical protein